MVNGFFVTLAVTCAVEAFRYRIRDKFKAVRAGQTSQNQPDNPDKMIGRLNIERRGKMSIDMWHEFWTGQVSDLPPARQLIDRP